MSPEPSALWFPLVLFAVFAVLSAVGAYLAIHTWRGRRAAVAGAVATVVFFAVLLAVLFVLLRAAGPG